jgi:hypothetical protein
MKSAADWPAIAIQRRFDSVRSLTRPRVPGVLAKGKRPRAGLACPGRLLVTTAIVARFRRFAVCPADIINPHRSREA